MAIGVFDSGVGGLSVHRALVDALPRADFLFLADQKNVPYGGRPGEEVVDLTRAGCQTLFERGAAGAMDHDIHFARPRTERGDGLVIAAVPAAHPTLLLLVRKRATTGAMTAAAANAILTQLESLHAE